MTPDDVVITLRAAGCVFAEEEAALLAEAAATATDMTDMVAQRVAGRPLEYIVGWVAFGGLRIHIDEGVFVPRRRTEIVATQAMALVSDNSTVVEMCCGAGAVAAAIAHEAPHVRIVAADVDPVATACARRNLPDAQVVTGDLFAPLPAALRGEIDILVANAPYVPTRDIALMPREARDHEPTATLDGGPDGLDIARRIITEAPDWLRAGGHLLIETSRRQAPTLAEIVERRGLRSRVVTDDDNGGTVVVGTIPGTSSP